MKLNMVVTPVLDASATSLIGVETDMLVLCRFEDGGEGPVPLFDELTNGHLSALLAQKQFTGKLGQRFTYQNRGNKQKRLLVIGLGEGQEFDCKTIARIVGIAVHKAVKHKCKKLSFQFQRVSRFTGSLKLASQAQFVHEAAAVKLGEYPGNDELTVELLCTKTGPARRELQKGLDLPITGRICCQHVDGRKCSC